MVIGTSGNDSDAVSIALPDFPLDLALRQVPSIAGLCIGVAGLNSIQACRDEAVDISCPVHPSCRKQDRFVHQIGMGHDSDPSAPVDLADHFNRIRLLTEDLIGGGILDHELRSAPVLLEPFSCDQFKDHLFLNLILLHRVSAIVQDFLPCHLHAVRIQTFYQFPVTADFGFHHRFFEPVKKRILPVASQADNVAVFRRSLAGDFNSPDQVQPLKHGILHGIHHDRNGIFPALVFLNLIYLDFFRRPDIMVRDRQHFHAARGSVVDQLFRSVRAV